jgi:hypothetical protein
LLTIRDFSRKRRQRQRKTARYGRAVDWSSDIYVFLICSIACAINSSMVRRI